MLAAVHEIHDQTKANQIAKRTQVSQFKPQIRMKQKMIAQIGVNGHARGAEAAVCVRLGLTHPQNACGHDDECRQRTDVHQFEQHVDVDETAGDGR